MSVSRIVYTVLFLVAAYSSYYLFSKKSTEIAPKLLNLEQPALSGQNIGNTSYKTNGIRSYRVTSTSLNHYTKSGDTEFDYPVLHVYKEGENEEWRITADKGVLDKDHTLTLYNNVLVKNLLSEASFDTMATEKLLIHLDNRDFWADNPVLLVGPAFTNKGQAMKGNFEKNIATLYNKVQGKYETFTP